MEIIKYAFYEVPENISLGKYQIQFISVFDHWLSRQEFDEYFAMAADKEDSKNKKQFIRFCKEATDVYRSYSVKGNPNGKIQLKSMNSQNRKKEIDRKIGFDSFYEWFGVYAKEIELFIIKGYEYTYRVFSKEGISDEIKKLLKKWAVYHRKRRLTTASSRLRLTPCCLSKCSMDASVAREIDKCNRWNYSNT